VVGFGEHRERETDAWDPRGEKRREERRREPELEDEVRGVARTERGEWRVCERDERVVVHPRERFFREVDDVKCDRDGDRPFHAGRTPVTNSMTARSI
jgi:hypothetical protein